MPTDVLSPPPTSLPPGNTVVLACGTYHETVQVYAKEVHFTEAHGADVVFDGARQVGGRTAKSDVWIAPWSTNFNRADGSSISDVTVRR
jgi:hypothetical protein